MSHTEQMRGAEKQLRNAAEEGPYYTAMVAKDDIRAVLADLDAARAALTAPAAEVPEQSTRLRGGVPEGEQRNREADRARFPDPNFNRWLDEAITENGEYTAWHALQSTGDAYAGWCVRPDYTGPAPEGHALVPVEPTPEMIEAARNVKRQRLVRAAADIKKGKHPDTIGMALSVNEEWTAMLTAAPQAPTLDAGVVRDARAEFEAMNRDSHGFKRSPRGTYQNPPVARDWKWFQAGIDFAKKGGQR